jgi:hypothetical protein
MALSNGCYRSEVPEVCHTVYNGALMHGVHGAVQVYNNLALETLTLAGMADVAVSVRPTSRIAHCAVRFFSVSESWVWGRRSASERETGPALTS